MERRTRITQRGQLTMPAEIRRLLGVKPRDQVIWDVIDGAVVVRRPRFTLETLAGSVKPKHRPEDFEKMAEIAREERVERQIRILRGE